MSPKPYVIACGVLGRDLRRIADEMEMPVAWRTLPGGLHETPDKLRQTLQRIIDEVSAGSQWSRIVLGYGTCGRGTVGLIAGDIPLVIPKVHDCIALFLGGNHAYRREFDRFPGTYYIATGWFEAKSEPESQQHTRLNLGGRRFSYDDLVSRVGEDGARKTMDFFSSWKRNYQRAAFIDTGGGGQGAVDQARRMAAENRWRFETIAGDTRLLSKLLAAEQEDSEVLVVPPGWITHFDALSGGLSAKPKQPQSAHEDAAPPARKWWVGDRGPASTGLRLGLGIDAGGTYTDAVVFDFIERRVLASSKALTTRWDYSVGIRSALEGLDFPRLEALELAAVSTTLATNAIVEQEGQRVGLMFMAPEGAGPADDIDRHPAVKIAGQLSITGRVLQAVDTEQVRAAAQRMLRHHQVDAFAVSGYAGHINPEHELLVKQIITRETGRFVCCGHELSGLLNFKVRARTAVLNARIIPKLGQLMADIRHLLGSMGIGAPIMVVKGDGSLMTARMAEERPVETILSGPAASTSGARFLTDQREAVVMDVGGTTTDTAMIAGGAVSLRTSGAVVGGHPTHIRAMEIRTTGLGGDSHVIHHDGAIEVGPRRVTPVAWLASAGHCLDRAMAFLESYKPAARRSTRHHSLIALTPEALPTVLSPEEQALVDLLRSGPCSIQELIHATGASHAEALPLERLFALHAVFRCGLTPTDLLLAAGELDLWDRGAARRAARITAAAAGMTVAQLLDTVRDRMVRTMAADIVKMHLPPDQDPQALDRCPICRQLMANCFDRHPGPLQARYRLAVPIIGIGAPAQYFLPQVARLLETDLILPPEGAVANAIGAVASRVQVRRQAVIKPDSRGAFYVEGLPGRRRFDTLDQAQAEAVEHLLAEVRRLGAAAGTRQTAVQFHRKDRTTLTAGRDELFLERIISASLTGPPDGVAAPNFESDAAPAGGSGA